MHQEPTVDELAPSQKFDQAFNVDHLGGDLARRATRGGAAMLLSQSAKFVVSIVSAVVLARLLTPEDYGLVGMVTVVINVTLPFRDLGLSAITTQRERVTHHQISTLFWINLGFSIITTLIVGACAPLIAMFYGEPRLIPVALVSAAGFIFGGLTIQHDALLKRQLRFGSVATIDFIALMLGTVTAIMLAWNGAGFWALVIGNLVIGAASAFGTWIACRWVPGLPSLNSGVRSMLFSGGNLAGFGILNYVSRNLDNLLIGRFWGAQQLGLYSRAYQLLLLPIQQVCTPMDGVASATLSKLVRSPERYRQAYLRLLEKVALLTMPGIALMMVTSDWLVMLALGPMWKDASQIFSWLSLAGLLEPVAYAMGWLLISQGRTKSVLHWGVISSVISVTSILIGLPWGAVGVAASYSIANFCIGKPLLFWLAGSQGPVSTADIYRTLAPAAWATALVFIILLAYRHWGGLDSIIINLAVASLIALITTFLSLLSIPSGRRSILEVRDALLHLKRSRLDSHPM